MRTILIMTIAVLAIATAAFAEIPWADSIIHTDPVLERGLGPEMVSSGYQLTTLTAIGRDGEEVSRYESWTSGRSGHRANCAFRPGEAVEAKCTGTRQAANGNKTYRVETWQAKRLVRCGNPTAITFYRWFEIRTITKTVIEPAKTINVHADVKVAPIQVNADVDVNVKPIKVDVKIDQSAAPAPVVYVTNVTNNFSTQSYPSGQMMGTYGATSNSWALLGVGFSSAKPTNISVVATGGDSNVAVATTNVNTNTQNAVTNIGDGSATGTATGTGTGSAEAESN